MIRKGEDAKQQAHLLGRQYIEVETMRKLLFIGNIIARAFVGPNLPNSFHCEFERLKEPRIESVRICSALGMAGDARVERGNNLRLLHDAVTARLKGPTLIFRRNLLAR